MSNGFTLFINSLKLWYFNSYISLREKKSVYLKQKGPWANLCVYPDIESLWGAHFKTLVERKGLDTKGTILGI